ncbi:MAG TPA: protein phosphatase 2C domain-containing protein [Ignavibacteria bacterium]
MFSKNEFFDVLSLHKPKIGKRISGDFTHFEIIEKESLIVCALADGVSTRKDDWLASKTACESVIEYIKSHNEDIRTRIENAAEYANNQVKDPNDTNAGMACAMAVIIWNYNTNIFHYVNVGDTRVHIVKSKNILRLTEDDTVPVQIFHAGKPVLVNGAPVFESAIGKIIGQPTNLDIDVFTQVFNEGESIVLSSDGIHKKSGLPSDIFNAISSDNISKSLNTFIDECIDYIEDDASVIIVRRNDFKQNDVDMFDKILNDEIDFEQSQLSAHIFQNFLLEKIRNAILEKNIENLENYLKMILNNSLGVNRDKMIDLFNNYCKLKINNMDLHTLFTSVIRKSDI